MTIRADTALVPTAAAAPTAESDPLLASKFAVPKTPPFTVERERLHSRLSRAVANPMTVVTGPPGSGKTQLVASWVSAGGAPGPVIWIALEEGDDEPGVFWSYLVEGFHRSGIKLSPAIEEAAHRGTIGRSLLARLAADLAAQHSAVVLVLDSVSVLAGRRLGDDLDALLRHADQHLRVVLVGRWDPPLPLYRYRLAGTLSEIRGDDLAFTAVETAALLAGHGVHLPDWALRSLVERTEGWAAGIRLFAMAMERCGDAEDLVITIAGDDANIAEYFLGEVLSAQPPEIRDFVLRTSIVDDFTPDLADVLTGRNDARQILAVMERANAFVQPVAERSTVHRYHRLFAELLRAQLTYEEPERVPHLHRRAAAWFVAHGRSADAIRHTVAAGDWEHACALVVRDLGIGRLVACGDADRLGKLFRDMPAGLDGPEPALVAAAQRLAAADPDEAEQHLAQVADLVGDDGPEQNLPLRLAAAILEAGAAAMRHDVPRALRAADAAEALMAQAPPERVDAHPELRTILRYWRGLSQIWAGDLGDAVVTLTDAVKTAPPSGCEGVRLACLQQLALADVYLGRLRDASDTAGQAAQLAGRCHTPSPQSRATSVVLAWVAGERWAVPVAWRHLRDAEAVPDAGQDAMATVAVALVRSRLLSGRGELRAAARVLGELPTGDGGALPAWLEREVALSRAHLAVVMDRPDEALAAAGAVDDPSSPRAAVVSAAALVARGETRAGAELLTPIVEAAAAPGPTLIEAWLVKAIAASEQGETNVVRDCLRQALALAAPDGHRRVFHEAGPRLRQLLRSDPELAAAYQSIGSTAPPQPRARPSAAPAEQSTPIVVDPLSERELEVLRHLAALLGTEEIAEAMYLSVNTVKTHVRSILRKLAASRRNEAVRRARELGLV
ncbi:LuxR C-terminal-related transcriptional regulator [Amorphoplanes digitatis]|uniref:LuxR family maltose regulon positive regulatory protein n=1 Tax=Actinoplanes digitatis TaxID=1868 RepID=A0A7W7I014_9ACTN|nr:LuxR C-terminal-related transcriptional regulator [Actinoplanes digitatis]MBB4763863.1 LuxR family maltose regulon positive regulatory protein [Actinoplanes digitatis]